MQNKNKKSLYEILDVNKTATEKEIRTAYKKLARKYHPDMHANKSEAEKKEMQEKFKEINNAYEILIDKNKREFYDATGMTEEEAGQQRHSASSSGKSFNGFPGGFGSFGFSDFRGDADFSDFGSIFGHAGRGFEGFSFGGKKQQSKQSTQKRPNLIFEYKLAVSLEEICNGAVRKLRIKRNTETGSREESVLDVNILPGYKYGTKITYKNAGDYYPDGTGTDVVVILTEKPHSLFKISDSNIIYEFDIMLKEYLAGFTKTIKGLKDNPIVITSELIGDNSKEIVIEGEGIPDRTKGSKRGKLIIKPRIIMNLTQKEKKMVSDVLL